MFKHGFRKKHIKEFECQRKNNTEKYVTEYHIIKKNLLAKIFKKCIGKNKYRNII